MSFIGWKAMGIMKGELLVGGVNNKKLPSGEILRKPFFYFGPVVHRHAHPTLENNHGIWSFKNRETLISQHYIALPAIAVVRVFGKVLVYENIYRSSHIAFEEIILNPKFATKEVILRMEKRYHCDVSVGSSRL